MPIIAAVIGSIFSAIALLRSLRSTLAILRRIRSAPHWLLCLLLAQNSFAISFEDAESALRRGDYTSAIPIYSSLADAGDARAMVRLGKLLQRGEGTPRDLARAVHYFSQAAKAGDAEGQYSLGNLYLLGEGVPQDDDWAFTYYRLAADQGHQLAQKNVNEFYRAAGLTPPPAPSIPVPVAAPASPSPPTPPTLAAPGVVSDPEFSRVVPSQLSEDEYRAIEFARARGIQVINVPGQTVSLAAPVSTEPAPVASSAEVSLKEARALIAGGQTAAAQSALVVLADNGNRDAQFLLAELLKTTGTDRDARVNR